MSAHAIDNGGHALRSGGHALPGGGHLLWVRKQLVKILALLDFSTPVTQSFPTTAAGLASALGDPAATASYIWDCQETSGNLVDSIATEPLVPSGSPLQGQIAPELDDGSGLASRKAVEFLDATAAHFASDESSVMDVSGASFAVIMGYRLPRSQVANRSLLGKKASGVGAGWDVRTQGGDGFTIRLEDSLGASVTRTSNKGSTDDGASHWLAVVYDDTAQTITAYIDGAASLSASTATLNGNFSNSEFFRLGDLLSWGGSALQCFYLVALEGSAAEAIDQAALDSFWTHASDPTGLLTTQLRNCLVSHEVAPGYVGHFAPNTLPIVHHDALPGTKLGLLCNSVRTNLIDYSESIAANWTFTGATPTANDGDSPDGFRSADKIASTTGHGEAKRLWTSVASTDYTESLWVQWVSGDKDFHLQLYDETGSALVAELDGTATAAWVRYKITGTTNLGQISSSLRFQPHANGGTFRIWGAQAETGPNATAYIRSDSGSTTSLVAHDYASTGFAINPYQGEIASTMVVSTWTQSIYQLDSAAGANRRRLTQDLSTRQRFAVHDDAGTLEGIPTYAAYTTTQGALRQIRNIWDGSAGGDITGGYEQVMVVNGTTYNGDPSPWENSVPANANVTIDLEIGGSGGGVNNMDGIIKEIVSYHGLSEALP